MTDQNKTPPHKKIESYKEKHKERAKKVGTPHIEIETPVSNTSNETTVVKRIEPKVKAQDSPSSDEDEYNLKKKDDFVLTPVTPMNACPIETIKEEQDDSYQTPKKTDSPALIYDDQIKNKLVTPIKAPTTAPTTIHTTPTATSTKTITNANTTATSAISNQQPSILSIYNKLWKTKLSTLVVITGYGAYACTPKQASWKQIALESVALSLGIFGQAALANTLNEIWEIERDAIMQRTKYRPLPQKQISLFHAWFQGMVMGGAGTALLSSVSKEAATLGVLNIGLYAYLYTPLKPVHWINTWVGTINGCIPPLMGSILASKCSLNFSARSLQANQTGWFMAALMYFWQIPHFMAISYKCGKEYDKAGYQMLSVQAPRAAARQAIIHAACLFPLCWSFAAMGAHACPTWFGKGVWSAFGALTTILNYKWGLAPALTFARDLHQHAADQHNLSQKENNERKHLHYNNATTLFWGSLKYLPVVFGAACVAFSIAPPTSTCKLFVPDQ